MSEFAPVQLDAYAQRIGFSGQGTLRAASLDHIHRAHLEAVAFENLDVLLKKPIPLDTPSLFQKIVVDGRGGYCFETNLLLMAVLLDLGHHVRPIAARVLYRATRPLPRTHMLLLINLSGAAPLIADVGFGGPGLLCTLPLIANQPHNQGLGRFTLTAKNGLWTLWTEEAGAWIALYAFGLEVQEMADLEMAHYFVSTHPKSRFTETLVCQRVTAEARITVRNRDITDERLGVPPVVRHIETHGELMRCLASDLELLLPQGTDDLRYGRAF